MHCALDIPKSETCRSTVSYITNNGPIKSHGPLREMKKRGEARVEHGPSILVQ